MRLQRLLIELNVNIAQPSSAAHVLAQAINDRAQSTEIVTNGLTRSPFLLLFLNVRLPTSIVVGVDSSALRKAMPLEYFDTPNVFC